MLDSTRWLEPCYLWRANLSAMVAAADLVAVEASLEMGVDSHCLVCLYEMAVVDLSLFSR